ncbi:MAG: cyclodeaminase/cyclohydrolase family protein, partial [Anaerolineales bacterium]|nr:cyclodeaminase/cyclohydrolase family protein [Anaerolineales bacterium]
RRVAHLAKDIVEMGNINAVTDAAVGALLAQTAVRASGLNIRTNSKNMADKMVTAAWEAEIVRLEKDVDDAVTAVLATAQQRGVF